MFEPNVIYEGDPQILTGESIVYKMWYSVGWDFDKACIHYAESVDGVNWTKYSNNPVVPVFASHSNVHKRDGVYYLYASDNSTIDLYTSTNGVDFELDTASVLTTSGSGSGLWDDTLLGNCHVWKEVNTHYMIYDANDGGNGWKVGLATSNDGRNWTKYANNPVLNISGGAWVVKEGIYYYMWCHGNDTGLGLPSDLYRFRSTDLITWTPFPGLILSRSGEDEGAGGSVGQIADPFIVVVGDTMKLYFTATSNGGLKSGGFHIKLVVDEAGKVTS